MDTLSLAALVACIMLSQYCRCSVDLWNRSDESISIRHLLSSGSDDNPMIAYVQLSLYLSHHILFCIHLDCPICVVVFGDVVEDPL